MAQTSRRRRLMGEINVVPYIDVMLVLLIIFMITAPLLTQGVKVDLPHAATEALEAQRVPPLVLSVDRAGRLYLNVGPEPQQPLDDATVAARASATLRASTTRASIASVGAGRGGCRNKSQPYANAPSNAACSSTDSVIDTQRSLGRCM